MRAARLLGVVLHFAVGFGAAAFFPLLPGAARMAIMGLWSRGLLAVLGVRLEIEGRLAPGPVLFVSNHVSWLDVLAINALRPCVFVCKSEIAEWPAFGWLAERAGTLFMRRGSSRAAARTMTAATRRLRAGLPVGVFPEGTSSNGDQVLAFSPALFQAALDAGCPVQPLALCYSSYEAVYAGGTPFGESMLAIAGARGLRVTLSVLPALAGCAARADAALRAHELIALRVRTFFTLEFGDGALTGSGSVPEF